PAEHASIGQRFDRIVLEIKAECRWTQYFQSSFCSPGRMTRYPKNIQIIVLWYLIPVPDSLFDRRIIQGYCVRRAYVGVTVFPTNMILVLEPDSEFLSGVIP